MPGADDVIAIAVEDDPTPLVRALREDLKQRLTDPGFASLTRELRGVAAARVGATPEAATIALDGTIALTHGIDERATLIATLDSGGRLAEDPIQGADEEPALAAWLRDALAPPPAAWDRAAARFWAALESLPGAPRGLLVVNLDTGEREQFGSVERPYELHGSTAALLALLEGRSELIEQAFERGIFIRGSFPEISLLAGAGFRVRMGDLADG